MEEVEERHSGSRSNSKARLEMQVEERNYEGKRSAGQGSVHSKKPESEKKMKVSTLDVIRKNIEKNERMAAQMEQETGRVVEHVEEVRAGQEEAPHGQEVRGKYSVAEDIQIIDYVKWRSGINSLSRNFWQRAVEKDNLLEKKRSIDSLRERYRNQLRNVTEADLVVMRRWVTEHGEKGYITFKSVPGKDSTGKIVHEKKFAGIELENTSNQAGNTGVTKSKSKQQKVAKVRASEKPLDANVKSANNGEITQIQIRFGQVHGVTAQDMDVDDIESVEDVEEVVKPRKHEKKEKMSKRREYENMNRVEDIYSRKATRENPINRPQSTYFEQTRVQTKGNQRRFDEREPEETMNQEAWLELQAERYNIGSEEVIDLFYSCSMNRGNLVRYLEGEKELAWNEDEDALLSGGAKDAAKAVLVRFKGIANVREREEFLQRVEQLRSMISANPQKQRAYSNQRARDFF
mmetsp:Transcript_27653/g.31867  ORF Transcript_27653/g.31867 Transcript_27653/m.31867 type:complete len:462 (+) Transcript_27653:3-1388(+)